MFERFTISSSSLALLKVGEQGVVARLGCSDEATLEKLRAIGVYKCAVITLEQRIPQFVIRTETTRVVLDEDMARVVFVRIASDRLEGWRCAS